jgi:hypothetical protein
VPGLGLMGSELFMARRAGTITYAQAVTHRASAAVSTASWERL